VWGVGSYAASYFVFGSPGTVDRWNGSSRLPESVPDGTSKTIFFTEKFGVCSGVTNPIRIGGNLWCWPPFTPPEADPTNGPKYNYASIFGLNHNAATNTSLPQIQPNPGGCNPFVPNSSHNGGINVAMGDGSTRFVTQPVFASVVPGMTYTNWHAASTAKSGPPADVLGPDWND
jgi:prepilin-type processing-associated H-X9-DG protein